MFCWIVLIRIKTKTITDITFKCIPLKNYFAFGFCSEKHGKVIVSLHQQREEETMPRIGNKFMTRVAMRLFEFVLAAYNLVG